MSEPWSTILTLVAGVATGVLSGMFGVGGAVVSTPAIRALGATPLEAVGSTLPSIVPSAVSGSLRYRREGLIVGRVARWTLAAGLAATVGGGAGAGAGAPRGPLPPLHHPAPPPVHAVPPGGAPPTPAPPAPARR